MAISKLGVAAGAGLGVFGGSWAAVRISRGRNWKPKNVLLLAGGVQLGGSYVAVKYMRSPSVALGLVASSGVTGLAYATASMVHQRADVPALANAGDNLASAYLAMTNPEVLFALNDAIDRLPAGATAADLSAAASAAQLQAMNGPPSSNGASGGGTQSGTPQPIVWNAR
jgi:hypothetical protein